MDVSLLGIAGSTFLGGAAVTYGFHRPLLNKEGIKVLGLGGLQGTALAVGSFMVSFAVSGLVRWITKDDSDKKNWGLNAFCSTYVACVIAVPVIAKTLTQRSPIEAFVKIAVSSVLGCLVGYLVK